MEMNLKKLFEMQKVLDARIEKEHPRVDGEDRLAKKILALQVELGELANEWRGFKFWSKDQEPRREETHIGFADPGGPFQYKKYPLLEEYVDCLHFILSIGLEKKYDGIDFENELKKSRAFSIDYKDKTTAKQFTNVFYFIAEFEDFITRDRYEELVFSFYGLGEMLGFTWEQIEQAYISKNEVNHERQAKGY